MFVLNDNFDITLTRGDSASIEITFEGSIPTYEDTVIMAVKPAPESKTPVLEKTLEDEGGGAYLLMLNSEDTADIPFGTYWWDFRIIYSDGWVTTPINPAKFVVATVTTDLPEEG